jgi:hypothetical protein
MYSQVNPLFPQGYLQLLGKETFTTNSRQRVVAITVAPGVD